MWLPFIDEYDKIVRKAQIDNNKTDERLQREKIYNNIIECFEIVENDISIQSKEALKEKIIKLKENVENYKYNL